MYNKTEKSYVYKYAQWATDKYYGDSFRMLPNKTPFVFAVFPKRKKLVISEINWHLFHVIALPVIIPL